MPVSREQTEDRHDPIGKRQRTLLQERSGATPDDPGISRGTLTVILGSSGAGKSTLLRCLNMLTRPSGGTIAVEGVGEITANRGLLRKHRLRTGMIFQQHQLIGRHTALKRPCGTDRPLWHVPEHSASLYTRSGIRPGMPSPSRVVGFRFAACGFFKRRSAATSRNCPRSGPKAANHPCRRTCG